MARRQSSGGYGLLVVAHLVEFGRRWSMPGRVVGADVIEAIEAGEPVTVSADLLFRSLFRVDHPEADRFVHSRQMFVLEPDGAIHALGG